MLCDGRIVCGCADPYGTSRPGRRAAASASHDVWTGPIDHGLRADLNAGGSKFCGDCPLKLPLKKDDAPTVAADRRRHRCRRGCTSSARPPATSRAPRPAARRKPASRARGRPACSTSICSAASSTRPARRSAASTSSTTAKRSCTSAPSRCASTSRRTSRTSTSTRAPTGWRCHEAQARRLVHSGIDEVTFSIDGATQESYAKYRQRGRLRRGDREPARDGRREAPRRPRPAVPELALHPLHWNDSDEEMDARAGSPPRSASIGCAGRLTDHPEDAYSRRFVPGSPDLEAIQREIWDDNNLGNAIPRRDAARAIDVARCCPGLPLARPRRPAAAGQDARAQPVDAGLSGAGDATAGGSSGSARSSAPPTARSSTAISRARGCPRPLEPGATRRRRRSTSRRRIGRAAMR